MKRTLATLTILLVSAAVSAGQEHKETGQTPQGWIKYTSAEGRYNVSLPQQPTLSTEETTASTGEKLPQYMALVTEGNGGYMVAYFDYPSDMTFSLDKARSGMVEGIHGTLIGEESISLGGSPGRQVRIEAKYSSGEVFIDRVRFYDVNRRIYVLQCIVPKTEAVNQCEKFFDSFKVETRPAP